MPLLLALTYLACVPASKPSEAPEEEPEEDTEPDVDPRDVDDDGDGYTEREGDCDDSAARVNPGANERANDIDDNCDGTVDEGTSRYDNDGDGYSADDGDCDDNRSMVHPGARESANGRDDDCDGRTDEGTATGDDDRDGYSEAEGDCNDADSSIYPGATERGDGVDRNCDGEMGDTWCGLNLTCPSSLSDMGRSGAYHREYWDFTWRDNAACGIATAGPYFINAPSGLRGMSATVDADAEQGSLGYFEMGGTVLVDDVVGTNGLWTFTGDDATTIVLPSGTGIGPSTGCTVLIPTAARSQAGRSGRLWLTSRRDTTFNNKLQFNFIVVGSTSISSSELSDVQYYLDAYLANAGMDVSSVTTYTLSAYSPYPNTTASQLNPIRSASVAGDVRATNVFFIEQFTGEPLVLGIAGGIPGPMGITQTGASGVVVALSPTRSGGRLVDESLLNLGQVIAHEAGHQLGLFHTTESGGTSHDAFTDTPACTSGRDSNRDGEVAADECAGYGAEYVMFWQSGDLTRFNYLWSTSQSSMLYASPVSMP